MEVLSLGWRTDLALLALSGSEIEQHPTYVVVRTLSNPTYRWGNFLLLHRPPSVRDLPRLETLFGDRLPGSVHRAFGVDDPEGRVADLRAFAESGYDVEASCVMTADEVHPPLRPNLAVEIRRLDDERDWTQRFELDLACHGADAGFEEFARRKAAAERRLTDDGHGVWFGAFDSGQLVSTLGVVRAGPDLARYQEVQTHPESRGRGLAGTLVHAAGSHALEQLGARTLVIVADPGYPAIRIYRSLGFVETESQLSADRPG